jgi:hypothetical protein
MRRDWLHPRLYVYSSGAGGIGLRSPWPIAGEPYSEEALTCAECGAVGDCGGTYEGSYLCHDCYAEVLPQVQFEYWQELGRRNLWRHFYEDYLDTWLDRLYFTYTERVGKRVSPLDDMRG